MKLNTFFHFPNLICRVQEDPFRKAYIIMHPTNLGKHPSCKFITKLLQDLQYSKNKSKETERNIATTRSLITDIYISRISNLRISQIQEDHNIHVYSLFCLVVLALENSRKPLLLATYRSQVFLYFHFQPKSKKEKNNKKQKFHTLFFDMT